jgi:hypothetical protein
MLLGCIAEDLIGVTDLSLMLSHEDLRAVQTTGAHRPFDESSQFPY